MISPLRRRLLRRILRVTSKLCASATLAAAILFAPGIALAQLKFTTQANVQYEENSNIFDLAPGLAPPTAEHTSERGDSFVAYGAGATVNYAVSQQNLTLQISGSQYQYNRFTELNHEDYTLGADWEWKFGPLFDGSLAVNRDRQMVAFSDFIGTQLSLQTDQNEHLIANFHLSPEWVIQGSGTSSRSDSPRPGLPNLSLTEDSEGAALKYGGVAGLQFGLSAQYAAGSYAGGATDLNPDYHQTAEQLVATYSVSPQSTLDFALGDSKRTSTNGVDNVSGVTGHLSLQRSLTAKTSVKLLISRAINSYITDTGSEVDTTASAQISYEATRKITINANYGYTYSDLPNQGLLGADRVDHFQTTEITIDYQVTKWLDLQPYARFQTRTSDVPDVQFSTDIYGVRVRAKWPD
jgi:Putative beta-barrel porin 2